MKSKSPSTCTSYSQAQSLLRMSFQKSFGRILQRHSPQLTRPAPQARTQTIAVRITSVPSISRTHINSTSYNCNSCLTLLRLSIGAFPKSYSQLPNVLRAVKYVPHHHVQVDITYSKIFFNLKIQKKESTISGGSETDWFYDNYLIEGDAASASILRQMCKPTQTKWLFIEKTYISFVGLGSTTDTTLMSPFIIELSFDSLSLFNNAYVQFKLVRSLSYLLLLLNNQKYTDLARLRELLI